MSVRPKKFLGQHFLKDEEIAKNIVEALETNSGAEVLEIGPGTGVLTKYLILRDIKLNVIEIDRDSIAWLKEHFKNLGDGIIEGDFLKMDLQKLYISTHFNVIGNFPYNISSQILFKVLEYRDRVDQLVGMLQKEVAQRITAHPGSKTYGILSVLLQAYYEMEYLFTVEPESFRPPPKVDSAVIRMKRNEVSSLDCDEKLFFRIVKQGFQNRRKTLRNALKPINLPDSVKPDTLLDKRAEALGVNDFIDLTNKIDRAWNH
jgi:16S rRNA (adenine1518-N6/adenine1519-N6)-dimethyltransferase